MDAPSLLGLLGNFCVRGLGVNGRLRMQTLLPMASASVLTSQKLLCQVQRAQGRPARSDLRRSPVSGRGGAPASGAPAQGLGTLLIDPCHSVPHAASHWLSCTHLQRKPREMPEQASVPGAVAPGPLAAGYLPGTKPGVWALLGEALLGRASTASRIGLALPRGSQAPSSFQWDPVSLCPPSERCAARTPSLAQSTPLQPPCPWCASCSFLLLSCVRCIGHLAEPCRAAHL